MFERIRVQNIQIVTFLNLNHCTSLYHWYVKIIKVMLYFALRHIIFKKYDSIFKLDFVSVKVEIVAIDLGTNYFIFLFLGLYYFCSEQPTVMTHDDC